MKTILIPTDFTASSKHALRHALLLSQERGGSAKLVLLNTYLLPLSSSPQKLVDVHDELRQRSMEKLNEEVLSLKKDYPIPSQISFEVLPSLGSLESVLGNLTREQKIDYVILGMNGHPTKEEIVKILKHIHAPLLIVPSEENHLLSKT